MTKNVSKETIQAIRDKVVVGRATREEILAVFDFAAGDTKNVHVTVSPTVPDYSDEVEETAADVLAEKAEKKAQKDGTAPVVSDGETISAVATDGGTEVETAAEVLNEKAQTPEEKSSLLDKIKIYAGKLRD